MSVREDPHHGGPVHLEEIREIHGPLREEQVGVGAELFNPGPDDPMEGRIVLYEDDHRGVRRAGGGEVRGRER